MGRFKPKQHVYPKEIEFLGLREVLQRSHPLDRKVPGIYFLIYKTEVVYVGQSTNLPVRIHQHRLKKGKRFDRFTVFPCPEKFLDKLERHYIVMFNPKYNGTRATEDDLLSGADAREAATMMEAEALERETRLELATFALARRRSTN